VIDAQWTKACRDQLAQSMNLTMHGQIVPGMTLVEMMNETPCAAEK
jgi:hypothetical protein